MTAETPTSPTAADTTRPDQTPPDQTAVAPAPAPRFFAPEQLMTDRFLIRRYQPGDGHAKHAATTSSYDHLSPWMPWASTEQTPLEAEVLARDFSAGYLAGTDFVMGIWSPEGELWGGTGFHPRGKAVLPNRSAEIGMWIRASVAGAGLGTDVLVAMLRWGFTTWPWERIEWRCDARNVASARCAENAGMPLEGTMRGDYDDVGGGRRDTRLYAMTRADHPDATAWTPSDT